MLTRRSTLLNILAAPVVIKTPGLLMAIKSERIDINEAERIKFFQSIIDHDAPYPDSYFSFLYPWGNDLPAMNKLMESKSYQAYMKKRFDFISNYHKG